MDEESRQEWTDDEVRKHLVSERPLHTWWYSKDGGYGFVTDDGCAFAVADDFEERAARIEAFLRKESACTFEELFADTWANSRAEFRIGPILAPRFGGRYSRGFWPMLLLPLSACSIRCRKMRC